MLRQGLGIRWWSLRGKEKNWQIGYTQEAVVLGPPRTLVWVLIQELPGGRENRGGRRRGEHRVVICGIMGRRMRWSRTAKGQRSQVGPEKSSSGPPDRGFSPSLKSKVPALCRPGSHPHEASTTIEHAWHFCSW